ncbi:cell division protein FtsZ, partial [Streptomyces sp. MnatMP-M17]
PQPVPSRADSGRSTSGLGTVPPREDRPSKHDPSPVSNEKSLSPVHPPHVPPARPYQQDSQAEELDVPDFLK